MVFQIFSVLMCLAVSSATPIVPVQECPEVCNEIYEPVCGSDGRTYDNGCALSVASCQNQFEEIETVYDGECSPAVECPGTCSAIHEPVCGSDGITYGNACALAAASCQSPSEEIATLYDGECDPIVLEVLQIAPFQECPEACNEIYEPVCGSDGKTYDNECVLLIASCVNDNIVVQAQGNCEKDCPTVCTDDYSPVCGSDGETYSNACALSVASCQNPFENLAEVYDGECRPAVECPGICSDIHEPVCGNDGITYGNKCALAAASCQSPSEEIASVYDGECDPIVPEVLV